MARKSVNALSENKIVRLLQKRFAANSPIIIKGIGDDAAVVHPRGASELWLVSSDMLLQDIDFRRDWLSPSQLGFKSLSVNLSDIAAMGGRPRFYTVSLGIPSEIPAKWISAFYQGMTDLGNTCGAMLIGGDLSRSAGGIHISITVIGESLERKVLYRSGGTVGGALYVTGCLGRSAAGLKLLKMGRASGRTAAERGALKSHRTPELRCEAGLWLAQSGLVSCMMDLSDGLSADLPRMCAASGVGAEIHACWLPTFRESMAWDCDPIELALHGGEDFELLFAVPRKKIPLFERSYPRHFPPVTRIGTLIRGTAVTLVTASNSKAQPLPARGFDHFRG